jgi:hypothetical protein
VCNSLKWLASRLVASLNGTDHPVLICKDDQYVYFCGFSFVRREFIDTDASFFKHPPQGRGSRRRAIWGVGNLWELLNWGFSQLSVVADGVTSGVGVELPLVFADLRRLFLFAGLGSSELTLQPGPISPRSVPVMAWTQSRVTAAVYRPVRFRCRMRS